MLLPDTDLVTPNSVLNELFVHRNSSRRGSSAARTSPQLGELPCGLGPLDTGAARHRRYFPVHARQRIRRV